MKVCRRCGETKDMDQFYVHKQMADGHLNFCRECVKRRVRERERWLRENDPEWLAKERERSKEKARRNTNAAKKVKTRRKKKLASGAVNNAVRRGQLVAATSCQSCGHDFSTYRREAHHEDYNKPLDVAWLCSLCHGKRHRIFF